ncbi:KH domain-containing, RNA-binding, signal transduction-associated protein 2-like [Bolinopsis microptera]|uniref:KH domain-containing, RNA-binding, signal transduction-associated protein 2-like n=1 Tax=Bolinopsis microptera TaxID=2820187 RepID=UPI003078C1C9
MNGLPPFGSLSLVDKDNQSYLQELHHEKDRLDGSLRHCKRLIEHEIQHVQQSAFVHPMFWRIRVETLPTQIISADGANVIVKASGKVYLPVQENPDARMSGMPQDFNFVGRLLGPRGLTLQRLQADTRTKMTVLGRGSMRDKQKEDELRSKPKHEHLLEELHVLIEVEGAPGVAEARFHAASAEIKHICLPVDPLHDQIKNEQLRELAVLNGTFQPDYLGGNSSRGRVQTMTSRIPGGAGGGARAMRPTSAGGTTGGPGGVSTGGLPPTFPRNVQTQLLRNTSPIDPFLTPAVSAKQQVPFLNEISSLLASYM